MSSPANDPPKNRPALEQLAKMADRLCEVRFPEQPPVWCPLYPDCGCKWPDPRRGRR